MPLQRILHESVHVQQLLLYLQQRASQGWRSFGQMSRTRNT